MIKNYVQINSSYNEIIMNILGCFSIIRPCEKELLLKLGHPISLTHIPKESIFKKEFSKRLPLIYELDRKQSQVIELIKRDDFQSLYETFLIKPDFDCSKTLKIDENNDHRSIEYNEINLLDVSSYYGSA